MDGYAAYADLLRSAVAQQGTEQREAMEQFQEKLAGSGREKGLISTASEGFGAAFAVPAIQKGVKAVGKEIATRVLGEIKNKLKPPAVEPEEELGDAGDAARTQAANDLGGAGERGFVETGEELTTREVIPSQEEALAQIRARPPPQGTTGEDLPEGSGEIEGEISRPVGAGEGSGETANAAGEAEQAAQGATANAAGGAGAAEGGIEGGAAGAAESAVPSVAPLAAEGGIDLALLADPLTAIFGLIFGIGIAAAGIAGADSVKNPSVPKVPTIANVSSQFGIGNNGS